MQACVNPFAVCTFVNLCACGGCLSVCFHACVCILPSICVQLDCAWLCPQPSLQLRTGVHLHSESQQLLPLLLWLGTANSCTHSCRASYVWLQLCWRAHGRHSNCHHELRPWSVSWSELGLHNFCELPGLLGKYWSSLLFLASFLPQTRWKLDTTLGSFWCHMCYHSIAEKSLPLH